MDTRDKSFYIVGFADGEGSFNISFRKRDDYFLGIEDSSRKAP
jgi:hypothetical protein